MEMGFPRTAPNHSSGCCASHSRGSHSSSKDRIFFVAPHRLLRRVNANGCHYPPPTCFEFGGGEQLEQPTCDCIVHHCCYQLWIVLVLGLGKASSPMIPIRAILERTVASAQLNFLLSSAANVTIIFYIPIYLQVLGISTGESGIRFIPMAVCLALSSFATGYLVEATGRYHYINILVQISSVTGSALLCSTTQVTPAWAPFVYFGLLGWVLGAPMLLDL